MRMAMIETRKSISRSLAVALFSGICMGTFISRASALELFVNFAAAGNVRAPRVLQRLHDGVTGKKPGEKYGERGQNETSAKEVAYEQEQ